MMALFDELDEADEGADYGAEEKIDNSDLRYSGRNICLRLNDSEDSRKNRIKTSEAVLCKRFPKLKKISSGDRMQEILDGMFPEGFSKQMYIRNLTFTGRSGYRFNPIILEYSLYFKPYCSIALYFITMSRQTVGHWSAKPCCEIH